ncbi:hypothetical protein BCR37DRAFT_300797 [Protomyces lactucae-debilis]|uniref:Acyltransferase 3 domain-containing protein n=1 Tax=Protomyces lactucae-debilis TaxID=2754530 RepID=A0A1Y2FH30_PROLT|nr:uncharacterized protein BCR37DRAFT_300797 [Protomyces lactucae-debilis]ORY83242.1 hypothetical protein BCR37DRAFT_300797 [Protomyces lactucae-debilis]
MFGKDVDRTFGSEGRTSHLWRLPLLRNVYASGEAMLNTLMMISGTVITYGYLRKNRDGETERIYTAILGSMFRRVIRLYLPILILTFITALMVALDLRYYEEHAKDNFIMQLWHWAKASVAFCNPWRKIVVHSEMSHGYKYGTWAVPLSIFASFVCYSTLFVVSWLSKARYRLVIELAVLYYYLSTGTWWTSNYLFGMLFAEILLWQESRTAEEAPETIITVATPRFWLQGLWWILFVVAWYLCGMPFKVSRAEKHLPGSNWFFDHVPKEFSKTEHLGRFWLMLGGSLLVICVSQLRVLRRLLEGRFLQHVGKHSYMLFLIQTDVIELFGDPLASLIKHDDMDNAPHAWLVSGYILYCATMVPVTLYAAGLATKYIYAPCGRLGEFLEKHGVNELVKAFKELKLLFFKRK